MLPSHEWEGWTTKQTYMCQQARNKDQETKLRGLQQEPWGWKLYLQRIEYLPGIKKKKGKGLYNAGQKRLDVIDCKRF